MKYIKDENQFVKIFKVFTILFVIAVFSCCLLSKWVPARQFFISTIDCLEESTEKVTKFAGAMIGSSTAISALPDDFATPLANSLADMNKYFVFILIVLFLEKLIVVEGTKIAFVWLIPIACGIYFLGYLVKKKVLQNFACKLFILAIALVLVIPCSVHCTNLVAADYLEYVDETIDETIDSSDKINEIITSQDEDQSFFEKLSNAVHTAMEGVSDLAKYFNNLIRKCINMIAILILTSFVVPLLIAFFFKWLLTELFFKVNFPEVFSGLIDKTQKTVVKKEDSNE